MQYIRRPYTKGEDDVIRLSEMPICDIARSIGRTYRSVYSRMVYLRAAGLDIRPKERKPKVKTKRR